MTAKAKEKTCSECGISSQERPVGSGGRCGPCGMDRTYLTIKGARVLSNMSNREMEKLLESL